MQNTYISHNVKPQPRSVVLLVLFINFQMCIKYAYISVILYILKYNYYLVKKELFRINILEGSYSRQLFDFKMCFSYILVQYNIIKYQFLSNYVSHYYNKIYLHEHYFFLFCDNARTYTYMRARTLNIKLKILILIILYASISDII